MSATETAPSPVRAWAERVVIPTYPTGPADPNPMFLEKRVYQGSSGVVYPYPVIDRIFDDREDREYTAVYLENEYLKIMILPEIGGRVQMALDKTNGYHFVYYNQVIKPALVGLAGPWISGGIEFNWPQHHRPTTFMPTDWRIQTAPDGSQTVWCGEIERMFHTKGMHGFTLRPGKATLEIHVQLYNRTSEPQTFLWWANPAVRVHDQYQSVFPPDVYAVMDHGKRDVSSFPIATGVYYKKDYAPGTDISRYSNIPVPTSYMAYHSDFDFVGDYDHQANAGMLHVANHHVAPGKKQWTWGCGDFGQAWDRQLTDSDGPYIELMCGAYTDNQPDFSWLQPGEEKTFTQVFMPYKEIGPAHNASQEAALRLDAQGEQARLGVYLTARRRVRVELRRGAETLYSVETDLSPEQTLNHTVALPAGTRPQELTLRVLEGERELLAYTPLPEEHPAPPAPAVAARPPEEIESNEELFLNGLHLEQYRHATYAPEPYYLEALRRDPQDSRCNNALGLLSYRRGKFAEAEAYFRAAVRGLTRRNPNPYDGEPTYNLGLSLKMQGRTAEAFDAFYKSTWNAAWQDAAYFELARLAARAARDAEALELTGRALRRNHTHHKARHLQIALLRRQGQTQAARQACAVALELDPLEYGALWELRLLDGDSTFERHAQANAHTRVELALDYAHAGFTAEAAALLDSAAEAGPMAAYFAGWLLAEAGDSAAARERFARAAAAPLGTHFPNELECVPALRAARQANPADAHAAYLLGNFWYSRKQYDDAIAAWEDAAQLDPAFPTAFRNLGLAYLNKRGDAARARQAFETAFALNPADARVFFELDQLYKKINLAPAERLTRLEAHPALVDARDDLTIERVQLLNLLGRPADALAILETRTFHPWEGGEGKTTGQYVLAKVEMARQRIQSGDYTAAVRALEEAQVYPHNLGEGKLYGAQENHIFYTLGLAYTGLGQTADAQACFERASVGLSEPTSAMFYNDQPPDMIFYQGLAARRLGDLERANAIFQRLVAYGQQHANDEVKIDYFAVSLPDFLVFDEDLSRRNRIHCLYMIALGQLGLEQKQAAAQSFDAIAAQDAYHLGAAVHRKFL